MRAALVAFALLRFGLRLELGPEYDTNANHVESPAPGSAGHDGAPAPIESFLLRGVARGKLLWNEKPHALRLALELGGKLYFSDAAVPQDVAILRLGLEERSTLSPHVSLGAGADYHEAFQLRDCPNRIGSDGKEQLDTSCHRDFRLLGARAYAVFQDGIPALAAELAARSYAWKPDDDLSFAAVSGALTPSARLHLGGVDDNQSLTLSAVGRVEYRSYSGPALRQVGDVPDLAARALLPHRSDVVATMGLSLSYAGPVLASASYALETDRSTGAGGAYLYQAVTLSLALPLPARFVAALRAQLLFFGSGELPTSLAVEDENRNTLVFGLSRELGANFTLHARYSVFRSAGNESTYLRQLVFVGASWESR